MLEVHSLHKKYGRKHPVLRGVSFAVPLNQLTCLIGLNGEGKSTILKGVMGLVPLDSGTVVVDGEMSRERIAFVPDLSTDLIRDLSKGNKAKVNLLLGFSLDRPYLLLDELLAGIDLFTKEQIAWIFSSHYMEGRGILMTTHEIAEVEHLIDRVVYLQDGKVVHEDDAEEMRELYEKSVQDRMREVFQR